MPRGLSFGEQTTAIHPCFFFKAEAGSKTYVITVSVSRGSVLVTVYDEAGSVVVITLVYVMLEAGAVV